MNDKALRSLALTGLSGFDPRMRYRVAIEKSFVHVYVTCGLTKAETEELRRYVEDGGGAGEGHEIRALTSYRVQREAGVSHEQAIQPYWDRDSGLTVEQWAHRMSVQTVLDYDSALALLRSVQLRFTIAALPGATPSEHMSAIANAGRLANVGPALGLLITVDLAKRVEAEMTNHQNSHTER